MVKTKIKIYVGCSLTHAPKEFRESVEAFKRALRAEGYEIMDFLGLVDGTPADVYEWDIEHCLKKADAFIAICDLPSTGLGLEMGEAACLNKPTLALAHKDALVGRIIIGAADVLDHFQFERYDELEKDGLKTVNRWLKQI